MPSPLAPTRRSRSSRRLADYCTTVFAWTLLGAMAGCGDDTPVAPPTPAPKYLPSSTPYNTLENLRRAYASRDPAGYDSLFDPAYIGTSTEASDSASALTFTKADESLHIRALASAPITSITMDFYYQSRYTHYADPPGWATIAVDLPTVEVNDVPTSYIVDRDVFMEFKFKPTTPSPGSPTDTTWHIVGWREFLP
jgi:hypothetical protein